MGIEIIPNTQSNFQNKDNMLDISSMLVKTQS